MLNPISSSHRRNLLVLALLLESAIATAIISSVAHLETTFKLPQAQRPGMEGIALMLEQDGLIS
jgi:hypothetical protein